MRQTIVQNTALEEYYGADLAADADVVRYRSGTHSRSFPKHFFYDKTLSLIRHNVIADWRKFVQ